MYAHGATDYSGGPELIDHSKVIREYRERAEACRQMAERLRRAVDRFAALRLAAFAAVLLLVAAAIANPRGRTLFAIAAGAATLVFALLIAQSRRLGAERHRAADIARVNEQAAFRAERDWARIDVQDWGADDADEARSDLDIFGSRSLVQLLPPTSTLGRARLRDWLLQRAAVEDTQARQESVAELSSEPALREELARHAMRARVSAERIARFAAWASTPPAARSRALDIASVLLPAATVGLFMFQSIGLTSTPLWIASLVVVASIAFRERARTGAVLHPAIEMAATTSTYAEMLAIVQQREFRGSHLRALHARLESEPHRSARIGFRRLAEIADWAQVSASPLLHAVLQALLMWDWHIARRLDAWRFRYGESVEHWLATLGEFEALAAFGELAHANPDWTFADVAPHEPEQIEARALGHPLLPPTSRVANDILIGPPGTVQVISGSNMSGKSTLLRAVGLNVVLAQAGAPVCAAWIRCPPVRLYTSIQVHDSLQQGLSYFMAEIRRLKVIIDAAEEAPEVGTPPVLYLVDEILRGTNSEERAVAARIIIQRLLDSGAIGIVTAHDLAMFDAAPIAARVRHQHFAESVEQSPAGERLAFDYRLRPGPTTSRNALKLLAMVGIAGADG